MRRRVIRLGDPTTHGGKVVSASAVTTIFGKPVARMGDKATCPIPGHGTVTIVEGDPDWTDDGKPISLEGHKCSCGCSLISTLSNVVRSPEGSGAASAGAGSAAGAVATAAGVSSLSSGSASEDYDLQFLVQGDKTGKPMANTPYKITLDNGREFTGKTDKNGLTQKVSADYPAQATLIAPHHDNETNTNGYCGIDSCCC